MRPIGQLNPPVLNGTFGWVYWTVTPQSKKNTTSSKAANKPASPAGWLAAPLSPKVKVRAVLDVTISELAAPQIPQHLPPQKHQKEHRNSYIS